MAKMFEIEYLLGVTHNKVPHATIQVPDGMWVCPAGTHYRKEEEWDEDGELTHSHSERTEYEVVGGGKIDYHLTDRSGKSDSRRGSSESWGASLSQLVSDRPFGIIYVERENGVPSPYHSFRAARQIHKGELGRGLDFPRPRFAREANRHRVLAVSVELRDIRRSRMGWARLVEVAALVGMPHERLVRDFYPFADSEGRGLSVYFAATREEIHGQIVPLNEVKRFTERDFPQLFDRNPANIWVRQGFAKTVLCLHALGYQPTAASKAA